MSKFINGEEIEFSDGEVWIYRSPRNGLLYAIDLRRTHYYLDRDGELVPASAFASARKEKPLFATMEEAKEAVALWVLKGCPKEPLAASPAAAPPA